MTPKVEWVYLRRYEELEARTKTEYQPRSHLDTPMTISDNYGCIHHEFLYMSMLLKNISVQSVTADKQWNIGECSTMLKKCFWVWGTLSEVYSLFLKLIGRFWGLPSSCFFEENSAKQQFHGAHQYDVGRTCDFVTHKKVAERKALTQ